MDKADVMNMSPNDYVRMIEKKDAEIQRLKKIVAEVTENIKIVGKQNTRLKKKCDRYEKNIGYYYYSLFCIFYKWLFLWI